MDIQLSHTAAVTFTRPAYKYSIMDEGEAKVPIILTQTTLIKLGGHQERGARRETKYLKVGRGSLGLKEQKI